MQPEKVEARNGGNRPSLGNQKDRPELDATADSASQVPFASPYGIALMQFDWGHPNELQTRWLTSKGVSFEALLKPWPIGATRVRFENGYFTPDETGERVITIVCFDAAFPSTFAHGSQRPIRLRRIAAELFFSATRTTALIQRLGSVMAISSFTHRPWIGCAWTARASSFSMSFAPVKSFAACGA